MRWSRLVTQWRFVLQRSGPRRALVLNVFKLRQILHELWGIVVYVKELKNRILEHLSQSILLNYINLRISKHKGTFKRSMKKIPFC